MYVCMHVCMYVRMYVCKAQQQGAPLAEFGVLGLLPWQLTSPRAQTRCLRVLPKAMHWPCSACSVSWLFWAGSGPKHMPAAYCQEDLHPCLTPVPAMQVRLWLYLVRSTTQVQPGWILLTLDWLLGLITLQVCCRCRCHKTGHAGVTATHLSGRLKLPAKANTMFRQRQYLNTLSVQAARGTGITSDTDPSAYAHPNRWAPWCRGGTRSSCFSSRLGRPPAPRTWTPWTEALPGWLWHPLPAGTGLADLQHGPPSRCTFLRSSTTALCP